jgi:tetratricopeptide (TPR) repeat protein
LKYYTESLEIKKRLHPSNPLSTGETLHNIGLVYKNQGKYDEALNNLKQSLEMKEQALPSNNSLKAATLNLIGIVFYTQSIFF